MPTKAPFFTSSTVPNGRPPGALFGIVLTAAQSKSGAPPRDLVRKS